MNFTALAGENINRKSIQLFEESTSSGRVFRCVRDPRSVYRDILELLEDENRNDDQCIAQMLLLCAVCLGCKDFFHQRHLRSRLRVKTWDFSLNSIFEYAFVTSESGAEKHYNEVFKLTSKKIEDRKSLWKKLDFSEKGLFLKRLLVHKYCSNGHFNIEIFT